MGLRTTVALLLIVLLLLGALYLTDQKPSDQGSVAVAALGGHTRSSHQTALAGARRDPV